MILRQENETGKRDGSRRYIEEEREYRMAVATAVAMAVAMAVAIAKARAVAMAVARRLCSHRLSRW